MRYMLLVYSPENAWTQDEWTACTVESTAVCHDLQSKGQFVAASPLHPVATAASVRVRNDQVLVTSGPFAETTEQLGGFFLIDAPNLDEAINIAARLPSVKKGTIEVRPVYHLEGVPPDRFTDPQQSCIRIGNSWMATCDSRPDRAGNAVTPLHESHPDAEFGTGEQERQSPKGQ